MQWPSRTTTVLTPGRPVAAIVACVTLAALAGCGSQASSRSRSSPSTTVPAYVLEPFTHQQQLVTQGAHLVVADGCSACHLPGANPRFGPSFTSFAGHRVKLTNGRRVIIDERFLHRALLDPSYPQIAGYDPVPMLRALRRLHLNTKPQQVVALTAFIEQVGPETE